MLTGENYHLSKYKYSLEELKSNEFVKTILTNQNIWLDVYTECINDPLKSDICQKCFKFSKDVEISEEAFKVIVEGALPKKYVESYEELYQIMVKYISNNLASEIIAQKLSKEIHIEYIKGTNEILEEQLENMATKISEEIFNRILVETNWAETYLEMLHIINFEDEKKLISLELLFDHCFQNDIMEGTVSTEEREFVYAEQKYFEIMDIELHETLKYGIKFYDDFLNDSLEKYGLK